MEQINDNLLFRWFVGFSMDDTVWGLCTFTKESLIESAKSVKI